MKNVGIRFFSLEDNNLDKKTKETSAKKPALTGYISVSGNLVFPLKTVEGLDVDLENTAFKVGMQEGKRKAKSLYLVAAQTDEENTFQFQKAAKSYTLLLPVILKKSGVDFEKDKYVYTVNPFEYDGSTALELQLSKESADVEVEPAPKTRGRKPKQSEPA